MDRQPPEHLDIFPTPVRKYDLSFLDLDKISEAIKQVKLIASLRLEELLKKYN